ncbi:MAG: hypothetical protein KA981_00270 [Bacteroidia bacterium]|jgi:hemoglobin-like flavoprotein|nr:hypothetical protein [Bacteroidia bacterium]
MISEVQTLELKVFWREIESNSAQFAELFYLHLFDWYPDLFAIFSSGLNKQQTTFVRMLSKLIEDPNDPKTLLILKAIGLRHLSFGILPEHYPFIRKALLVALSEAKPDMWNSEIERAWIHLCSHVEQEMTN